MVSINSEREKKNLSSFIFVLNEIWNEAISHHALKLYNERKEN